MYCVCLNTTSSLTVKSSEETRNDFGECRPSLSPMDKVAREIEALFFVLCLEISTVSNSWHYEILQVNILRVGYTGDVNQEKS